MVETGQGVLVPEGQQAFPGGLGVTEASLGTLLAREYRAAGLAAEAARTNAASAVILIRLCTLWFAVLVGFVATGLFQRRYGRLDERSGAAR